MKSVAYTPVKLITLLLVMLFAFSTRATAEELQTMDLGNGMTLTYPVELEATAQQVAQHIPAKLLTERARFLRVKEKLADRQRLAVRVTQLLGCPEYTADAQQGLDEMLVTKYNAIGGLSSAFSHLRLIRDSDIPKSGEYVLGPLQLTRDQTDKKQPFGFEYQFNDSVVALQAINPVIISSRGMTWPALPMFDDGFSNALLLLATHEASEMVLIEHMDLYSPCARWFNEGVAHWVMMQIAKEYVPEEFRRFRDKYVMPYKGSKFAGKINLCAWTQVDYDEPLADNLDKEHYRYATKIISDILDNQPSGTLAAILQQLHGQVDPTTDAICKAIQRVTGKDAAAMLRHSLPKGVQRELQQGQPAKLYAQAAAAAKEGDFGEASKLLRHLLTLMPEDINARYQLAWTLRHAGKLDESTRQLRILGGFFQNPSCRSTFANLTGHDDTWENSYFIGRIYQFANLTDEAKSAFTGVAPVSPYYPNAQAALKELEETK